MKIPVVKPLSLNLQCSKQITFWVILIHLISLVCINLYAIQFSIKLALMLLVLLHASHVYIYYVRLIHVDSVRSIELNTHGQWLLRKQQQWIEAELLDDSLVTHYLMVLNFKTKSYLNTSVILMRDSVSAEEWRRLRVYLGTH